MTRGGRSMWCTWRRSAEHSICPLSVAESRRDISASGYLLYFSGYYYHSSFAAPGRGFARSRCLFWTASFSPTLFSCALPFRPGCIYIWVDPARFARPSESTRGFTPGAPSALGTKGAPSSLPGRADCPWWEEISLPPPYEHHHDYIPSSPIGLPSPRPALIIAARIDLPIRALLLRVVASPVCSTPRLRMRSPYRRTCTVCVHISVRIPLRLPKHRPGKQDRVVEHVHLLPAPHLPPRGREDLGADAHARFAPRCAPALLVVPGLPPACGCRRGIMCAPPVGGGATSRGTSGNSYLCGRLAAPPIWDAIRTGAGGRVHMQWDVQVPAASSCWYTV
ncbi:hypothetical protein B0H13DRAFT_326315 [Mycena leptocephala]|nr:hypothetical protein B0H13DRAFT_326315 [Mycena leptocephala]